MTKRKSDLDLSPVFIGIGDFVDKNTLEKSLNPLELFSLTARKALADTQIENLHKHIDYVGTVRLSVDYPTATNQDSFGYKNISHSIANNLNIRAKEFVYTSMGGNAPQVLIEDAAKNILSGNINCALLSGGETLKTMIDILKSGENLDWYDDPKTRPREIGENELGFNEYEKNHKMDLPTNVYPLFAQAIRKEQKKTVGEHLRDCAHLFSKFSKIAADNPYSWFQTYRSPEDISEVSQSNRYVGYPYTKYLNSVIRVNMGSSLVLTSYGYAKELGIPENKCVFLTGLSIANDVWNVSERPSFTDSPAIKFCVSNVFNQSNTSLEDYKYFDIYSCFPSAVQVAMKEIGINDDFERPLTVTGGLPYFGGPGNSYTIMSTSEMVRKLRSDPGKGLLTANSWFLTKHAAMTLSSSKPEERLSLEKSNSIQNEINSTKIKNLVKQANGDGKIDTYTIINGRKKLECAIIIGTLENGSRFLANSSDDQDLASILDKDLLDLPVKVEHKNNKNYFKLI